MTEVTAKERFLESLKRCADNPGFMESFYERFLASSVEVKNKFVRTDFKKQHAMLIRSLKLAAEATSGNTAALREIHDRAETHDHNHLDIKPHLYDLWLASVIETASEFDPIWNETIGAAWRNILGLAIQQMIKHY